MEKPPFLIQTARAALQGSPFTSPRFPAPLKATEIQINRGFEEYVPDNIF